MHFIVTLIFLLIAVTFYQRKILFSKFIYLIAIIYPILPYTYYSGKVIGSLELFGLIIILYLSANIVLFPNGLRMRKFIIIFITFSLCGIISMYIDFDVFKWFLRLLVFTGTLILLTRVFSNDKFKIHSFIKYSVIFSTIIVAEFLGERLFFIFDWAGYYDYKSLLAYIGFFPMKVLQINYSGWSSMYPVVRTGGLLGFDGASVGLYFGAIYFMIMSLKKRKILTIYQFILVFCIIGCMSRIAIFSFFLTYIIMIVLQKKYFRLIVASIILFISFQYISMKVYNTSSAVTYIMKRSIGATNDSYGLVEKSKRTFKLFNMFSDSRILSAILVGDSRLVNKKYGGDNPHNGYMQILFSSGLVGLILFLIILYRPTKYFLFNKTKIDLSFSSIMIFFIIHNLGASYFFQLKEMFVILPPLAVYLCSINIKTEHRLLYNTNEFQR